MTIPTLNFPDNIDQAFPSFSSSQYSQKIDQIYLVNSCWCEFFKVRLCSYLTFFLVDFCRPGTEKVRQAQGCKHLHVVNPDWLWSCLERWERVEEQLYPLKEDYSKTPR